MEKSRMRGSWRAQIKQFQYGGKIFRQEKFYLILSLLLLSEESLAKPKVKAKPGTPVEQTEFDVRTLSDSEKKEIRERNVDKVALSSQQVAIKKIESLLNKYRGQRQEPALLEKLAESFQIDASIRFRIAHAEAHSRSKPIQLREYKQTLTRSITTLNQLIGKYPNYPTIDKAWFLRGKAHEEIGNIMHAEKDYQHLVVNFPESEDLASAYMSLANFAIDAQRHAQAVQYLEEIEKRPWVPHYPFALYKLAWSHYNLRGIPKALNYLKRHISIITQKAEENGGLSSAEKAMRENSLRDVTLFYLDGFEIKLPEYNVAGALDYFKKLEDGPFLGDMILKFAVLLRAHNHEHAMNEWKEIVLNREIKRHQTMDVVLNVFDYQLQSRQFEAMIQTSQDFVKIYKANFPKILESDGYKKTQGKLLETADTLQKWTIKNKEVKGVNRLSNTLASIYDTFTQIVDESDPRIPGAHYNLAETLFKIKDFSGATEHYRWIVQNGNRSRGKQLITVEDASLKSIASHYEVLISKGVIPKKLDPRHIKDDKKSDIPKTLEQWVSWIDTHQERYPKTAAELENFEFEANRALYANGRIIPALLRMIRFAKRVPHSKYAKPSASLVLDTYVKSEKWESAHELAARFETYKPWQEKEDKAFHQQLYKVASDTFFKMVEDLYQAKEYEKTLAKSDEFLSRYMQSSKYPSALFLSAQAAHKLSQEDKAIDYYSRLIEKFPNSENMLSSLLSRSQIYEKRYQFAASSEDYRNYLKAATQAKSSAGVSGDELNKLRRKILYFSWLAGSSQSLADHLANPLLCNNVLSEECEQYRILLVIQQSQQRGQSPLKGFQYSQSEIFKKAISDEKDLRPLWAVAALQNQAQMSFPDRMLLVRVLAGRWEKIDPIIQYSIIGHISLSIPEAFKLNSQAMKIHARLQANEKAISRRVKLIEEMELSATQVIKNLPWSRIRASVLNEVAQLYLDFSTEMAALKVPTGMAEQELAEYQEMIRKIVLPFEEKGYDIKRKAFEIASTFAIEDQDFVHISRSFFNDNPSQAKNLQGEVQLKHRIPFDKNILLKLDPSGDWHAAFRTVQYTDEKQAVYLKNRWAQALEDKNWPLIAFYIQEGKNRSLVQKGTLGLMKAVSFAAAGARGEGLMELEGVRTDLEPLEKSRANLLLVSQFASSLAKEKTKGLVKAIHDENLIGRVTKTQDEAFILVYAADWSKVDIEESEKRSLLQQAKQSSLEDYRAWARKRLSEDKGDKVESKNEKPLQSASADHN